MAAGLLAIGNALGSNYVFVTSTQQNGNLGGLAGADALCQARAVSAGLPGTYRAWLSAPTVDAESRFFHSTSPYVLTDGTTVVANNWSDLVDGELANSITMTEQALSAIPRQSFTGSFADGTRTFDDCNAWTSATSAFSGTISSNSALVNWSSTGTSSCATARSLYCIQTASTATISGRVLISGIRRGITHAAVVVSGGGLAVPQTYFTDRRGNFLTAALPNGATYTVTASQHRFSITPASRSIALTGSDVTTEFIGIPLP
jgi:hypothetical protein